MNPESLTSILKMATGGKAPSWSILMPQTVDFCVIALQI